FSLWPEHYYRRKLQTPNSSPGPGRKKAQQSPGSKARYSVNAPGHCFRKVTLTKPTFCHHCSDFIWGIVGFVCEGKMVYLIFIVFTFS
uniref:Phorbol-ester/DAG-type domain-containing protein n=1 Tax=Sinocyclocheilus grahami TaxID=75366 RepID=A0A672KCQ0_SINGR